MTEHYDKGEDSRSIESGAEPPRGVIRQVQVGSTTWAASEPLTRAPGRVCIDCGAKLSSYEPHRLRCTKHERFRRDALMAASVVWSKLDEALAPEKNTHVRRKINIRATALAIGILSSPYGGWREGKISTELESVLMIREEKLRLYVQMLKSHKNLVGIEGGWWKLDVLPYVSEDKHFYTKKMRRGEHSLTAQDLIEDFLTKHA